MRLPIKGGAPPGDSTAAVPAALCGRHPTQAKTGPRSKARSCPKMYMAESAWMFRVQIRTSSSHRSKWVPARGRAAARNNRESPARVDPAPAGPAEDREHAADSKGLPIRKRADGGDPKIRAKQSVV